MRLWSLSFEIDKQKMLKESEVHYNDRLSFFDCNADWCGEGIQIDMKAVKPKQYIILNRC
jgi:hypothetical protein